MGTAATPLLALYLPPIEAAALLLPILICQDAISVQVYWHEWSAWNLKVLLPNAAIGMALGWLLASYVSDDATRILIGVIALAVVASVWLRTGHAAPKKSTVPSGLFWGAVSGFTSFASQGGGPPYQMYTLPQQLPKMVFVGTTTIFFAAVNVMKIVPYFMLAQFSAKNFSTSLALLPIAMLANFAGIWMVKSVPTEQFYRITLYSPLHPRLGTALAGREPPVTEMSAVLTHPEITLQRPHWLAGAPGFELGNDRFGKCPLKTRANSR